MGPGTLGVGECILYRSPNSAGAKSPNLHCSASQSQKCRQESWPHRALELEETVTHNLLSSIGWGWELSGGGGGGQVQSWRGRPSEFGFSPSLEARGAAFQELQPEAGPKLGTVPKTPSQRPPGAWATAHSLAPFPITTPSPLFSCFSTWEGLYC